MRRRNRIAAVLLAGTLCLTAMPTYALADGTETSAAAKEDSGKVTNDYLFATLDVMDGSWLRKGGSNRYETMEQVVQATFDRSTYAIIATGDTFADALLANGLAGTIKCPVLLTARNALSPQAESELERLDVKNIYIVGNTSAVSAEVESKLTMAGYQVKRIAGGSDQETSIKVLEECRKAGSPSENVIIATSKNFPDALSIGPYAYKSGSPILFTDAAGMLSDAQVAALKADSKIKHALVIGGATAVSDEVAKQLGDGIEGWRIGGKNRYETSAKVADWCVNHGGLSYNTPVLTTASNFPDALCGAALAAKNNSVLIVADKYTDETIERLRKNAGAIHGGFVLGGKQAMPIDNPLVDPQAQTDANGVRDGISQAPAGGVAPEPGKDTKDDKDKKDSSEESHDSSDDDNDDDSYDNSVYDYVSDYVSDYLYGHEKTEETYLDVLDSFR